MDDCLTIWIYLSEILIKKIQNLIRASIHMIKIVLPILFCRCHLFFAWTTFLFFLYHFFSTFFYRKNYFKKRDRSKNWYKKKKEKSKRFKNLFFCISVFKVFYFSFFFSIVSEGGKCFFVSVQCFVNEITKLFAFLYLSVFFFSHFCYQTLVCWKFLNFIFFSFHNYQMIRKDDWSVIV